MDNNREQDVARAMELNNAELFNVHRWSTYPEVNQAVDSLYQDMLALPNFKEGKQQLRKKHIKVIVLDLYVKWLKDPLMYVSYYRANWYYDKLVSRYNKLHISRLTPKVTDALEHMGYVTQVKGYFFRDVGKSRITRMRATDKLIDLIQQSHITDEMVEIAPDTECIILRAYGEIKNKQMDIPYDDNDDPRIKFWRRELCTYNNLLRKTFIDIPSCPEAGIPTRSLDGRTIKISQHEKFVKRIFNNADWGNGGRFYGGWWQRIPSEWRSRIRIWNMPVTEIDFSGLHIALLYALNGMAFRGDPYMIDGFEPSERMRSLLKLILLASINAKDAKSAKSAVQNEINFNQDEYSWFTETGLDVSTVIESFAEMHAPIRDRFFSNAGIRLQYLDSLIAEKVINHFTAQDIPVLCIHDSFIIAANKNEELKQQMEDAFQEALADLEIQVNHLPKVTLDGLGLGQWNVILSHPDWRDVMINYLKEEYDHPEWHARVTKFRRRDFKDYYAC